MTREEAKEFMWIENDKNPLLRWGSHASIRNLVSSLIDKIYDDFENEEQLQKPKEVCNHEETTPYYEYVRCNECGAIKTDSDSSWGIAKNKWFKNKEEAYFYKEKGYLPTCENKGTA